MNFKTFQKYCRMRNLDPSEKYDCFHSEHPYCTKEEKAVCCEKYCPVFRGKQMSIRQRIADVYGEDLMFMDGYDDCILGVVDGFAKEPVVAYDRDKVLKKLTEDGMTAEEALEFSEYVGRGAYALPPFFINGRLVKMEDKLRLPWKIETEQICTVAANVTYIPCREFIVDCDGTDITGTISYVDMVLEGTQVYTKEDGKHKENQYATKPHQKWFKEGDEYPHSEVAEFIVSMANAYWLGEEHRSALRKATDEVASKAKDIFSEDELQDMLDIAEASI